MDVGGWLRNLGLGQYEALFRANEIDADILPELSEADLEKLGVPLARISHSPWVCRGEGKGFALSEFGGVGSTDYVCRRA